MAGADEAELVLVVDDEPSIRALVTDLLRREGYETLQAASAYEALDIISERKEDLSLLLTDIVMPGMDGLELGEKVEMDVPHLPILYITAFAFPEVDFAPSIIAKPFTPEELIDKVKSAIACK